MSAGHGDKTFFGELQAHNVSFLIAFVFVFVATLVALTLLGAVPVPKPASVTGLVEAATNTASAASVSRLEEPVRVVATSIGLDEAIQNPGSTDIAVLDAALAKGAVRYPGSAYLGADMGNVLLFGHSSYLRTVNNGAFRTFNDIQKLNTGEVIKVYSATSVYEYKVTSVRFAKAEEATIDLSKGAKRLTLVTCNSFGTKSDRFIVEAEFVRSYPLAR